MKKKFIPDDLSKWQVNDQFMDEERLRELKEILYVSPEDRTKSQCISIAESVKTFKFFNPYKESKYFPELCKYLKIEHYSLNDIVFRQGDRGNCLYFILEGTVSVNVNLPSDSNGMATGMKELLKLQRGAIFGELALMQESPRTATAVIVEPTDLMILEKSAFQKFIKDPKALNVHKIKRILASIPLLANLDEAKLEELTSRSVLKKFDTNTLLIKQKSLMKYFCFIKNGFLKIYRSIHFRIDLASREINGDITDPTAEEIEAGIFKLITLEIAEIGAGEMFAEYAASHKKPIDYSAITIIPSDIILIKAKDFKEVLGSEFDSFKRECRNYPTDEELRRKYYNQKEWNEKRLDVIRKTIQLNVTKKKARERLLDIYEEEKDDPREQYLHSRTSQLSSRKFQVKDPLQSSTRELPQIPSRRENAAQKASFLPMMKLKGRSQSVSKLPFGKVK